MPQRLRPAGSPTHRSSLVLAALAVFFAAPAVQAKPAHKKALIEFFGPALPTRLHNCQTCHLPDTPDKEGSEKPHNAFGKRLVQVREELHRAGKKTDIPSRILALADEDADGDGVSNILELLAGSNPGDPASKPTSGELTVARHKWDAFRKELTEAYAWRPFEPVKRPPLPALTPEALPALTQPGSPIRNPKSAIRNPIDLFLAAEHERQGLIPRPEAPKAVLLRRVYLDLVGLPPTRADVEAFLADTSPGAYERVVDRLLASPAYGERWGRHWMDVWRYSDWAGYGAEVRDSQPFIWHWRDWIIESLNEDVGYDRMVQEMLAADELAPGDEDALRATGFLVRNWYKFNRNVWLDRIVEHTGKAFLGITLNCARCHDHFFDPIGQKEYYAFRAIFEPHNIRTDRWPGEPDLKKNGLPRVFDAQPGALTHLFVRGDELNPDKGQTIPPAVPAFLGGNFEINLVSLPPAAVPPGSPATSTGRRLALARWITDTQNPLTARVAVNHIWMRHFGSPLVPTVFDFGQNGLRPTHPALVDWLAAEFMENGWSMKHLHRLIVTSSVYRTDSTSDPASASKDPDNRWLWRINARRMEAEAVRDSLLAVSGQLDRTLGGPDLDHNLGLTLPRRSLYFRHAPEKQMTFLMVFDAANMVECYRRSESIVPHQALALANSTLALAQARVLARKLSAECAEKTAFIRVAFEQVLCRPPTDAERDACLQFLEKQTTLLTERKGLTPFSGGPACPVPASADPHQRAREDLVGVLLNHHEFVTVR
jgi:hypothetical protein